MAKPVPKPASSSPSLPHRPHLDQLRRQAKALLAGVQQADATALALLREHLPAARGLSAAQIQAAGFRLADAQSAIARQSGFASWPSLGRHVEQLRALEGTWEFRSLEVDGEPVPAAALGASRLLIDGDRFRMESPEADYEGVFDIDVEQSPNHIDIEFVSGPEAGNWSYGRFELNGDALRVCLGLTGAPRPESFSTSPGSGHALESLHRVSGARPAGVEGGVPAVQTPSSPAPVAAPVTAHVPGGELERLAGKWRAVELVLDGKAMPKMMLASGQRTIAGDELRVTFGGQVMVHARLVVDAGQQPMHVEYVHLAGAAAGRTSLGIMAWDGDVSRVCMAAPGAPRPEDFSSAPGSGRTLSGWRRHSG